MTLDRRLWDRARQSRDARFDGRFFIGVTSTGIYCRPICPARAPRDEHIRYFARAAEAEAAGFRPCLRCRPDAPPGTPAWHGTSGVVSRALRLIGDGVLDEQSVETLAECVGVTGRHLRRLFLRHLGAAPLDVALTRRVQLARQLLHETTLPVGDVAFASGFRSLRRFNEQMRRTYTRTPTELRRPHSRREQADCEVYRLRLPYRAPYDWDAMMEFLGARAIAGVEAVDNSGYRRTIAVGGHNGSIRVYRHSSASTLGLDVRFPHSRALQMIVDRVRRMFDLGANPIVIAEHLRVDPFLRAPLATHPGVRTPGAWDGFELAVRAILGQQVSVRAATAIAGRLAEMFGSRVREEQQLQLLFPTPEQLANAAVERAGATRARADTIRALSQQVLNGTVTFEPLIDPHTLVAALHEVPGIGGWTAQYIAMRALGEPDALPSGDLVLRRAVGDCTARELERRAERWRPWRSYAVILLWLSQASRVDHKRRIAEISHGHSPSREHGGQSGAARDSIGRSAGRKTVNEPSR